MSPSDADTARASTSEPAFRKYNGVRIEKAMIRMRRGSSRSARKVGASAIPTR